MNASPETNQNPQEPLKTTDGASALRDTVIAAVLFALASATVPIAAVKPWVGVGLWAAMPIGCVFLLRRMRLGVSLTLVASVAVFLASGTYLFTGPLVTALAVGTFVGAFLMTTLKKPFLACLLPLLSAALTVPFTRDPVLIASALSLLPAAALTAYATKRKMGRSSVICFGAGGLLGAALIAVGTLISALTENQLIAAVSSIAIIAVLLLLSLLAQKIPFEWLRVVVRWFSVVDRYTPFTVGYFDIPALIYFISFACVFIFLTVRVYEKRRWS